MKVWVLWHGGHGNYSPSEIPADVEAFSSLGEARWRYEARRDDGHWMPQDFAYVNRPPDSALVPGVGADSSMWVFFYDPTEVHDPYPDRIIATGPRGGTTVSPT